MALFEWKNGTKIQNAVVTSDGTTVQDAVWEGETPISAANLNQAQNQMQSEYIGLADTIKESLGLDTNTYDNSLTYSVGDLTIYNNRIYECIEEATTEEFDSGKWELVPLFKETE